MNTFQRAMISWVSAADGGRKHPPSGPSYSTMARFEEDAGSSHGEWSLVVEFEKRFKDPRVLLANVRFLVDAAPHHLLHSGSRFELFEGRKRVAKGIVLPPAIPVPEEISEFEAALIG
jgi:hypothetical protein